MKSEMLTVRENSSAFAKEFGIIVTLRNALSKSCQVVLGSPGQPNTVRDFEVGDAHLFETTSHGLIEIRAMVTTVAQADFLISEVSPTSGLLGGTATVSFSNSPFSEEEIERIASSFEEVKDRIIQSNNLSAAQFQLLCAKIDDANEAALRLGRKDWVNYVASTLTSVVVTAGITPETGRAIFAVANAAFKWLFNQGLLLLV